jgi:hypothetical protein
MLQVDIRYLENAVWSAVRLWLAIHACDAAAAARGTATGERPSTINILPHVNLTVSVVCVRCTLQTSASVTHQKHEPAEAQTALSAQLGRMGGGHTD